MTLLRGPMIFMLSMKIWNWVWRNGCLFRIDAPIPESLGIAVKTREGNIVYTGDFKFDQSASESMRQIGRLLEIGREGVLAFCKRFRSNADSTVQVASESEVGREITDTIPDWDGL